MSRIDEALRISEDADGIAVPRSWPFEPGHFLAAEPVWARSRGNGMLADEPCISSRLSAPSLSGVPAPVAGTPKLLADADLQARLVTGTSSTVSLEQYRRLGAVLHEAQAQNKTRP